MAQYAHKGEILPLANQMIPIDKETTLHASYDYHLNGMNRGETIFPMGPERCFDFNGTNSIVNPGKIFDSTPSAVTVEVWFNARGISGYPTIVDFGVPGNAFYMEQFTATKLMVGGYVGTGGANFTGLTNEIQVDYTLNTWTHVAYTATPTDLRVYVNGQIAGNYPASYNLSMFTNPITIGGGRNLFNGMIADVRVWNFAKSGGQIKDDMYKAFSGGESGLVAYWKLNEREGNIAYDASGNGRDGAIGGTIVRAATGMTVATLQKNKGKFGGAVLIEPNTTNLMDGKTITKDVQANITHSTDGIGDYFIKTDNTIWYAGVRLPSIAMNGGDTYTWSFEIMSDVAFNIQMDANVGASNYSGNDSARSSTSIPINRYDTPGQWKKIWLTATIQADAVAPTITDAFCPGNDAAVLGRKVYHRNHQVEKRDYPTSYVKDSRLLGKLWYPKELINPSAFTISCWFNIPYVHRASTGNTGIQGNWYHPIIELVPSTGNAGSGYSICVEPNTGAGFRQIRYRMPSVNGAKLIQDGQWYHLVATWDGTTHRLYIDGVQAIATTTFHGDITNAVLMVGGGYYGKANIMIDELRIESRAISVDEVAAWAASGLHYNYLDYSSYVD